MSTESIKHSVRERARFKCENCNQFTKGQYAHIVPEADGGDYDYSNLLYLCWPCHINYEPASAKGDKKSARIVYMHKIKDRPKVDSLVNDIFELPADTIPTIHLGEGLTLTSTPTIFTEEPSRYTTPAFLRFEVKDGLLQLYGLFKDEVGKVILEFLGTQFKVHTADIWDITRKNGKFELVNRSRRVILRLHQQDDLSIDISGSIYLAGVKTRIGKKSVVLPGGNVFNNSSINGSAVGIVYG